MKSVRSTATAWWAKKNTAAAEARPSMRKRWGNRITHTLSRSEWWCIAEPRWERQAGVIRKAGSLSMPGLLHCWIPGSHRCRTYCLTSEHLHSHRRTNSPRRCLLMRARPRGSMCSTTLPRRATGTSLLLRRHSHSLPMPEESDRSDFPRRSNRDSGPWTSTGLPSSVVGRAAQRLPGPSVQENETIS